MNLKPVKQLLESADDKTTYALLDNEDIFFWVDWREEDDAIVRYCESILHTETLSAEFVDVDNENGCDLYISYKNKQVKVPLTYSGQDRHITICWLNEILRPDYEIRFCTDSNGSDTLAFVPLSRSDWNELEKQYGMAVNQHFYRIAEKPNLFTDSLDW